MDWSIYLKTTETCNLNCKHCFTSGANGAKIYFNVDKSIDWFKRFSQHISDTDNVHIEFHGGEPFLAPIEDLNEFYNQCKDFHPNISWGITTNLTFKLKQEHIDFIKGPLNGFIGTSWDPKIRFENEKQSSLWLKNVKTLMANGIDPKLFVSVTKSTIDIEPIHLLSWIKVLGFKQVSFERLTQNGNANLYPEIFPLNTEQDKWLLTMHKQSQEYNARDWFENELLESVYAKFEKGFNRSSTFCRDCEEKLFTINADGSISGCPNSAPEEIYGHIDNDIYNLINNEKRIDIIACERSRDPRCFSCPVFEYCGGDCHQLSWQDDVCGAPKSLMMHLGNINKEIKIFNIKDISNG